MGAAALFLVGSLCLAITVQAQDCSRPVGGPNMGLKGNDILLQTFPDGTRVSFACDVGYTRAGGSPAVTCTAGSWSRVTLICERKNCGSAGEVPHGVVDYPQGTEFGDKAVINCNDGYALVGRKEITCLDQGWDSRLPTCEEVTCDPPPVVTNATFSPDKDSYGYREVVQYSCKSGYTLNGTKQLSCSDGGKFTPDPPTCVKVQCYEPDIANGEWVRGSRPPYGHMSVVTYQCKTGYKMNGESTLTCGINSQWLPKLPTCVKVQCYEPDIANAEQVGGSRPPYWYSSTVTYQCKTGYKMNGESTLTCGIDGQWSPKLPTCEKIEVPKTTTTTTTTTTTPVTPKKPTGTTNPTPPDITNSTVPDITNPTPPDITNSTDPDITNSTDPDITNPTDPDITNPTHPDITKPTVPDISYSTDPDISNPTPLDIDDPTTPHGKGNTLVVLGIVIPLALGETKLSKYLQMMGRM